MWIINPILDFLFPKNAKTIELESLSIEKLWSLLPQSDLKADRETLALFDYRHPMVKEIIWEIKYNGNRILAEKLGAMLYDVLISELEERNIFAKFPTILLLPMPISDKRRFERGWNQAELLGEGVMKCDSGKRFKYLHRLLAKVRHTESQTQTRGKSERLHNLTDSMKVLNPLSSPDSYVVLIDDVTTTGSTFTEAKRALRDAGVKKILCVALAH